VLARAGAAMRGGVAGALRMRASLRPRPGRQHLCWPPGRAGGGLLRPACVRVCVCVVPSSSSSSPVFLLSSLSPSGLYWITGLLGSRLPPRPGGFAEVLLGFVVLFLGFFLGSEVLPAPALVGGFPGVWRHHRPWVSWRYSSVSGGISSWSTSPLPLLGFMEVFLCVMWSFLEYVAIAAPGFS